MNGDIFGEGLPPDPGPFEPEGPFGVDPLDPWGDGFDPPWGWGDEGPVYRPPGGSPPGPLPPTPPPTPPPATPAAMAINAATVAAIAVLLVEVASILHACYLISNKGELQKKVDALNDIRDRAVKAGTWTDALQTDWSKANEALARRAEQLQKELDDTWIMWFADLIY